MSDKSPPDSDQPPKDSLKKDWKPGASGRASGVLFLPDELDIFTNKASGDVYIFHGKPVDYDALERLEYDPKDHTVDVVMKDGSRIDLGVKIQWLIRPYFARADSIKVVQTKDGESLDGVALALVHKEKNDKK